MAKDPTVTKAQSSDAEKKVDLAGAHASRPIEEADDSAPQFSYEENSDKPAPSSVAQHQTEPAAARGE